MLPLGRLWTRLQKTYHDNYYLLLLLALFVSFRLLALFLLRPGGFIVDSSDYDYYLKLGQLSVKGYVPNENLVTAYPPIFPTLAVALFELSSRIPPWIDPRLFFHVILGGVLLVFETGNFLLIADIARRLAADEGAVPFSQWKTLGPPLIYMLLFAPVSTWLGFFEPMPLFFMLLGLDLLLVPRDRAWAHVGSGAATALGFLTKLTPMLLVPIAVRWLGLRLSARAIRHDWFRHGTPANVRRAALYLAAFFVTLLGVGYLFARHNPELFFLTLNSLGKRLPWETVWALVAGQYGFGSLPVDERNPAGLAASLPTGGLPWGWISAAYLLIYLWLYTRPYDWSRPRTVVSFTAVSLLTLFLYSRGWSPQFQVWVLAFVALLLPDLYGVIVAIALMLINYVELEVYIHILKMDPAATWILVVTVLARTGLLLGLALLLLGQIWPRPRPAENLRLAGRTLASATTAAFLLTALLSAPQVARLYEQQALSALPCAPAVEFLTERAGGKTGVIATPDMDLWRDLYPWLRGQYQFVVLDDYSPHGKPAEEQSGRLAGVAQDHGGTFWWAELNREDTVQGQLPYFKRSDVHLDPTEVLGECRLTRVTQSQPPPPEPSAQP